MTANVSASGLPSAAAPADKTRRALTKFVSPGLSLPAQRRDRRASSHRRPPAPAADSTPAPPRAPVKTPQNPASTPTAALWQRVYSAPYRVARAWHGTCMAKTLAWRRGRFCAWQRRGYCATLGVRGAGRRGRQVAESITGTRKTTCTVRHVNADTGSGSRVDNSASAEGYERESR